MGSSAGIRARIVSARPAVASVSRSLRRPATRLSVGWSTGSLSSRFRTACLMPPSRRTRIRLAIRSLTATRSTRRIWAAFGFAGVAMPGGARQAGERGRGEAEPVLARELDLAELVADHQLLDRRQRHRVDDRFDVEAVAGVGRHAARARVRVGQEAGGLELGEDAAHGRAGHAQAVALDQGLAADRLGGRDVFLDDGPKDRLRAEVQGAEGATIPTRQTRSPALVSTR